MCAGGPPKPMTPIRVHSRATVRRGVWGGFVVEPLLTAVMMAREALPALTS
jgi:hypothetical protein